MKKFAFIVSVFLLPRICFAGCGEAHISFQGFQKPGDDEFIYMSTADYKKAIVEEDDGNNSFPLNNTMWECDDEQGCKHYTAVLAPSGHAWNKSTNLGEGLYWCTGNFGDKWEPYDLTECDDNFYDSLKKNPSLEKNPINMNGTTDKTVYRIYSNGGKVIKFCYTNPERVKCLKVEGTVWMDSKCQCLELDGKKREWNDTTCIEVSVPVITSGTQITQQEKRQQQNTINQQSKKECESSGGTWAASKCTCDQTKNLRLENNKCVCLNNTDYTYNAENKRCDLTNLAEKKMQCESEVSKESGAYWYNNDCMCQTQDYVWIDGMCKLNPKIDECRHINGAQWLNNECVCNDKNMEINEARTECVLTTDAQLSINQSQAKEKISSAISELDEISSGLKLTVWRNEEGKFNTSRLLSDSIAGVVLGTAGGLITSNVVKKNQVENGFEDIQCSVGGQVVAGWGDEFRVGIQ